MIDILALLVLLSLCFAFMLISSEFTPWVPEKGHKMKSIITNQYILLPKKYILKCKKFWFWRDFLSENRVWLVNKQVNIACSIALNHFKPVDKVLDSFYNRNCISNVLLTIYEVIAKTQQYSTTINAAYMLEV